MTNTQVILLIDTPDGVIRKYTDIQFRLVGDELLQLTYWDGKTLRTPVVKFCPEHKGYYSLKLGCPACAAALHEPAIKPVALFEGSNHG